MKRLLSSRMLKNDPDAAKKVAEKITTGYVDHGYCINRQEAQSLGLKTQELTGECLKLAWTVHRLTDQRSKLAMKKKKEHQRELLKNLPPEILEQLSDLGDIEGDNNG